MRQLDTDEVLLVPASEGRLGVALKERDRNSSDSSSCTGSSDRLDISDERRPLSSGAMLPFRARLSALDDSGGG